MWFLPYLSGERTPHNNPQAKGAFWGLTHQHGAEHLARAVLEGVGFALADGMDALACQRPATASITLIGGGARSPGGGRCWRISVVNALEYRTGGDVGPALGAARLAQIAMNPQSPLSEMLPELPLEQVHIPDAERHSHYTALRSTFRELYSRLLPLM